MKKLTTLEAKVIPEFKHAVKQAMRKLRITKITGTPFNASDGLRTAWLSFLALDNEQRERAIKATEVVLINGNEKLLKEVLRKMEKLA